MSTDRIRPEVLSQDTFETKLIHWNYCQIDYPLQVFSATGGTMNDTIIICGGSYQREINYTDNCYSFKESWKNWKPHVNMTIPRGFSASIVIGDMIWITGGYDGHKTFASTEQIYLNKTIRTGPTLPTPIDDHCIASDKNTIFFVGGSRESKRSDENYDIYTLTCR